MSISGGHDTKYVDGGHGFVAYQEVGSGPPDIVYVTHWGSTVEGIWDSPAAEKFLRRLGSFGRLILFDKRGTGVSDPLARPYPTDAVELGMCIEEAVADIETVINHLGVDRVTLVANSLGATAAVMFAATRPERTAGLALIDPMPRDLVDHDYPWGMTKETCELVARLVRDSWGNGQLTATFAPSLRHDAGFLAWAAQYERVACPRGVMANFWENMGLDVRPLLTSVQCPTVVMHHPVNVGFDVGGAATYTASQIAGAIGPIEIPTRDREIYGPQPDLLLDTIESFLAAQPGGERRAEDIDRVFAVVAFTDLVDSTRTAADLGDRRWSELLAVHDSVANRQIGAHRGRLIKRTGDGVLATFDAPARAIRCVQAISAELNQIGVKMRCGVHAGEIELRGDDIGGLAVHIGARIVAEADPAEVLVSRTVTDLVTGSGIAFSDRGEHELKGVPGAWRLFAVRS